MNYLVRALFYATTMYPPCSLYKIGLKIPKKINFFLSFSFVCIRYVKLLHFLQRSITFLDHCRVHNPYREHYLVYTPYFDKLVVFHVYCYILVSCFWSSFLLDWTTLYMNIKTMLDHIFGNTYPC